MIRMQMQSGTNQPIIIQTAPIQAIQQTSQPQIIQVSFIFYYYDKQKILNIFLCLSNK